MMFLQYHPNAEADIQSKADKYAFCSDLAEKHSNEYKKPKEFNCILSTLRKPNSLKKFSKTKKLANIFGKIPEFRELDNRDAMMKNPVIHE